MHKHLHFNPLYNRQICKSAVHILPVAERWNCDINKDQTKVQEQPCLHFAVLNFADCSTKNLACLQTLPKRFLGVVQCSEFFRWPADARLRVPEVRETDSGVSSLLLDNVVALPCEIKVKTLMSQGIVKVAEFAVTLADTAVSHSHSEPIVQDLTQRQLLLMLNDGIVVAPWTNHRICIRCMLLTNKKTTDGRYRVTHSPDRQNSATFLYEIAGSRKNADLLIWILREHHVWKMNYSTNKVQVNYITIWERVHAQLHITARVQFICNYNLYKSSFVLRNLFLDVIQIFCFYTMFITFVRWRLSVGIKRFTYLLTYVLAVNNHVSLTTQIPWPFPDFSPTLGLFPDFLLSLTKFPDISRFPEKW